MASDLDQQQITQQIYDENANIIDVGTNCSTSNITRINASTSDTILLIANSSRRASIFYNESSNICYITFGPSSSTINYTLQLAPNSSLIINSANYTGQINAIWSGSSGAIQITELTR